MEAMLQSGVATVASTLVENLKMERTSLHSAAQELKILRAPGRPVPCVHAQRIWRRGVVTPPPAPLALLKRLQQKRAKTQADRGGVPESRPPQG